MTAKEQEIFLDEKLEEAIRVIAEHCDRCLFIVSVDRESGSVFTFEGIGSRHERIGLLVDAMSFYHKTSEGIKEEE
jgi:hypothetical protein